MILFALHLILAIGFNWVLAPRLGLGGAGGFALGLGLAFVLLWGISRAFGLRTRPFERVIQGSWLALWFLKELVKSCLLVARDCIRIRPQLHPAVVRMPITPKGDLELFVLSSLITLTPGTLTMDVAEDRSHLLIHSIYAEDPEALVAELQAGMEANVAKVFRA